MSGPNDNMEIDQDGTALEDSFEHCILRAYDDARPAYILQPGDQVLGTLTIGWGHTGADVHIGDVWTQEQADTDLAQDNERFEVVMRKLVTYPCNQEEWNGLCTFVLNVGIGNFARSTMLKDLNAGNLEAAIQQFPIWDRSKGVELAGLLRRRLAEQAMFQKGVDAPSATADTPEQTS